MSGIGKLINALVFLSGLMSFVFHRQSAQRAVQQARWLTGTTYDERMYAIGFRYLGLVVAIGGLFRLLGVLK